MEKTEKKSLIEALLFISGEPVTLTALKTGAEMPEPELKQLLDEMIYEYKERNGGVLLIEIANGYQLVTNPHYAHWVRKFRSTAASNKLSMPALETLAIIAYKQPIIKAELEQIRGVNSDGVVKTLLDRRLVKIMGRKEMPGKPLLYGTTREFLEYFGLKDLTELPTIAELTREEAA
ncbi:MAG: SMC-Scp complex subunit ScpB [Nitrospiraceae bacterium]|nr:SMC-Scp complex subunit ScpB [Nitrospiraceae bacterium]